MWNERGVVGRGQIHEVNAVGELLMARVCKRDGEACLPHATGTDKGYKARDVESSGHAFDIALPANEGCGCGQGGGSRLLVSGEIRNFDGRRLDRSHELVSVSYDGRDIGCLGKGI